MNQSTTPPGWYPDPNNATLQRWWDGTTWTEHTAPAAPAAGGVATGMPAGVPSGKKVPAGIFGILLGSLGIHKFYLGYKTEGLIMLLVTVLTCGLGAIVMGTIGLVEGIIYLTKSDEEFDRIYVYGRKPWF